MKIACPNHEGNFDCTPFCGLCEGDQEITPPDRWKTYRMQLVIQDFYIAAETEEKAEEKYDAFHMEENCIEPEHKTISILNCGCVAMDEDVYHLTQEMEN